MSKPNINWKDEIREYPNSSILVLGCRLAGKTELVRNMIIEDKLLFDWADLTIVMCQAINADSYTNCGINPKYIFFEYRDDVVNAIIEQQREMKATTGKMLNIWIIVDDILSSRRNKSKAINSERGIEYLYSVGRHFSINCTVLTQSIKWCGMLYQNADHIFVFGSSIRKKSDKEEFKKEILSNYTEDMSVFDNLKAHEFLYMHLTSQHSEFEKLHDVSKVDEKILKFKI